MSDKTQSEGQNPAVSVVMPAYNSAPWIEESLATVLGQTVGPERLEVIVVDDGSSDGTADVAERWLTETPLSWRVLRQSNRGPGAARNAGWRAARAPWIQFLDADDLVDPEKIEIQLRWSDAASPEVAVIFSSYERFGTVDARWEVLGEVTPRLGDDVVAALLQGDNAIATGAQLYSRDWLERVGGWNEEHAHGEDHHLGLRVAFAGGRFVHAPSDRALFFYRRHGPGVTSLTTRSGQKNAETWVWLARFVEDEWRRRGELTPGRAALIANMYGSAARWLADYDWPAAQTWARRAFEVDPTYRPGWSKRFQALSSLVGFERALRLAALARRVWRPRPDVARLLTLPSPAFARSNRRAENVASLG
jgi:glycosyltransferase involved in cell wall biosynthesis